MANTIQKTASRLTCTNERGLCNRAMRIHLIAILCAMLFFGSGLSLFTAPSAIAKGPSSGGPLSQEEKVLNELRFRIATNFLGSRFLGGKEDCKAIIKGMPRSDKVLIDGVDIIDKKTIDECTVETVHNVLKKYVSYDRIFRSLACEYTDTFIDYIDQFMELKKRFGAPDGLGEIPPVPSSLTTPDELAAYMKKLVGWFNQALADSFVRDPCPYAEKDCAILSQLDETWEEYSSSLKEHWTVYENNSTTRFMWLKRMRKPDCPPKDVLHLWTKSGRKRKKLSWPYKYVIVRDKDGKKISRLWDSDPGNLAVPGDLVKNDKGVRRVDGASVEIVFPEPLSEGIKKRAISPKSTIKGPGCTCS